MKKTMLVASMKQYHQYCKTSELNDQQVEEMLIKKLYHMLKDNLDQYNPGLHIYGNQLQVQIDYGTYVAKFFVGKQGSKVPYISLYIDPNITDLKHKYDLADPDCFNKILTDIVEMFGIVRTFYSI